MVGIILVGFWGLGPVSSCPGAVRAGYSVQTNVRDPEGEVVGSTESGLAGLYRKGVFSQPLPIRTGWPWRDSFSRVKAPDVKASK